MDWEDLLIVVGVVLLVAAAWLMYGLAGVLGFLGIVLFTTGLWVAVWRYEKNKAKP